ncbi:uncharacterized protein LOC121962424 [Plectropomus leopardus]|uniref:uncharacterized protein LOC121962424 n=1 Tax=Plectropomus leopardus TaxID=160734 RepID=UPI001C4CDBAD|nr:uncharacterized protein LOC121962424 [Plectropomus leopardus]
MSLLKQRSRRSTLPPYSNRTLHHPSSCLCTWLQAFHTITRTLTAKLSPPSSQQSFSTLTPPWSVGGGSPNIVSDLVFDCFQLNTPPPVMSACLAPPARPDLFRSASHPTRDLGSLTFRINTLHVAAHPNRVILQLTQEEDQALTHLLKLHHQEPLQSDESLGAPPTDLNPILFLHSEPMDPAERVCESFWSDVQHQREASLQNQVQQGRCWSDSELEAANTLMSRFSLMEEDKIWGQNHDKSAVTLSDAVPYQCHEDSSISTESQQSFETLPASITHACAQNNIGYIDFCRARTKGRQDLGDFGFLDGRSAGGRLPVQSSPSSNSKCRSSAAGDFPEVKEQMLSESEEDAVNVLLSLGEMEALDVVQ